MVLEQEYQGGSTMMYGYEDYFIQWMSARYFSAGTRYSYTYDLFGGKPYRLDSTSKLRMADDSETNKWLYSYSSARACGFFELPSIAPKVHVPKDGETLFFDKACSIPRIKCEGKWQRTIKITKADVVVVPRIGSPESYDDVTVFADDSNKILYVLAFNREPPIKPIIGQSFGEWHELCKSNINSSSLNKVENRQAVQKAFNAVCIFHGTLFAYKAKHQFIFDIIDGLYPRIVCEDSLLQLLGSEEERFTPDVVESLVELLNSKDKESVHQGLRVLASMDYAHYPSITKYILKMTQNNWSQHRPFNSAVKFMMSSLGSPYCPFEHVTVDEFLMARDIFNKIIELEVNGCLAGLQRQTNLVIEAKVNIDTSLPENPSEQPSEEPEDGCESL